MLEWTGAYSPPESFVKLRARVPRAYLETSALLLAESGRPRMRRDAASLIWHTLSNLLEDVRGAEGMSDNLREYLLKHLKRIVSRFPDPMKTQEFIDGAIGELGRRSIEFRSESPQSSDAIYGRRFLQVLNQAAGAIALGQMALGLPSAVADSWQLMQSEPRSATAPIVIESLSIYEISVVDPETSTPDSGSTSTRDSRPITVVGTLQESDTSE
jgi:hypothetical protein